VGGLVTGRQIIAVLAIIALSGCSTTNPEAGAGIDYRLPRTDVTVTLGVDLKQCMDKGAPDVTIETSLKADAVAGVNEKIYHLSGAELSSSVTKKQLTIDADENGVISAVNTTATDQRTVILGNILKIAATVASVAARAGQPVVSCSSIASTALAQQAALKSQLDAARAQLPSSPEPAKVQKQIDALAAQLVAVKATLHRDLIAKVKLDTSYDKTTAPAGKPVEFDPKQLGELLNVTVIGPGSTTKPMDKSSASPIEVKAYYTRNNLESPLGGTAADTPMTCGQWMMVPASTPISFVLNPTGMLLQGDPSTPADERLVKTNMTASQLENPAKLCLSAAFGENRTIGLKFDKFGRTTEFSWSADARAANIAGGLAGAAPDAAATVTGLRGSSLAADKRELDQLTTQQALKKARDCQDLLDAGASSCPKD
jgi:hypothetical protein